MTRFHRWQVTVFIWSCYVHVLMVAPRPLVLVGCILVLAIFVRFLAVISSPGSWTGRYATLGTDVLCHLWPRTLVQARLGLSFAVIVVFASLLVRSPSVWSPSIALAVLTTVLYLSCRVHMISPLPPGSAAMSGASGCHPALPWHGSFRAVLTIMAALVLMLSYISWARAWSESSMVWWDWTEMTSREHQDGLAFRVWFDKTLQVPDPSQMYWRGAVLPVHANNKWRPDPSDRPHLAPDEVAPSYEEPAPVPGPVWRYRQEPVQQPEGAWFTLETTRSRPAGVAWTSAGQARLDPSASAPRQWQWAQPQPLFASDRGLQGSDRSRHLQLTDQSNPLSRALARSWRQKTEDPRELVGLALAYFQAHFSYTLTPPQPTGLDRRNSIDFLMFKSHMGYCQHFSDAFAVLMREAGVPSRIVLGYYGARPNRYDDYWVVGQDSAHAWVEVWIDGDGWVRVDPTQAVSSTWWQSGVPAWKQSLEELWDAFRLRWIEPLEPALRGLGPLAALCVMGFWGRVFWRRYRRSPWDRAVLRLRRHLASAGVVWPAYEGALSVASRLPSSWPATARLSAKQALSAVSTCSYGSPAIGRDGLGLPDPVLRPIAQACRHLRRVRHRS